MDPTSSTPKTTQANAIGSDSALETPKTTERNDATQMNRALLAVGDATPKPKTQASIVTPKTKTTERSDATQTNANVSVSKPKTPIASVASEILGVTMMVGGFLFSKYIF